MYDAGEKRRIAALRKWFAEKPFVIPEGGALVLYIHGSLPPWLSDELMFSAGDEDYLVICHKGSHAGEALLSRLDDVLTVSSGEDYEFDGFCVMVTCHA